MVMNARRRSLAQDHVGESLIGEALLVGCTEVPQRHLVQDEIGVKVDHLLVDGF